MYYINNESFFTVKHGYLCEERAFSHNRMEFIMGKILEFDSRIKDVYDNPVGHDIIKRILLQMGKSEKLVKNPVIRNLKLRTVAGLTKKFMGRSFFLTLLELLNSGSEDITEEECGDMPIRKWWKEAVIYQVYPRSFKDSDGDGIGDLNGIISKLDYFTELGIDAIWLSPVYDSPNDDNGYDIRDYYAIQKEFGTMEDFDRLLNEAHSRGIKVIMDLVINHTSDEHAWFQDALNNPDSEYRDYYLFKKSGDGGPPNNWTSFFGGSAWNYYDRTDEWALHLFSKKQMDLNWENERLRKDIHRMVRWWLDKGVDGFRLDVINYISKKAGLPDGDDTIGKLIGFYGIEHYFYGPKLHEYLKELKKEAFEPYDAFTVGETPGAGIMIGKLLTADYRKELDMIFSFDHLESPGHTRFDDYRYDLNFLKEYLTYCMEQYGSGCRMSLFYENHDNPRMVSKVDERPEYRTVLAKLLAMIQLTLNGTPFIYQGQEIGSVNHHFSSVEELKDVESINLYHELAASIGEEAALKKVLSGSRDHSRTPMQWEPSENAGFSDGEPWISLDEDYKEWNVKDQMEDPDSVWRFYQRLISLRKDNDALIYGDFKAIAKNRKDYFIYIRKSGETAYLIECNLSSKKIRRLHLKEIDWNCCELLMSNYPDRAKTLRPYEANLYRADFTS